MQSVSALNYPHHRRLTTSIMGAVLLLLLALAGLTGLATHAAGNDAVSLPFDTLNNPYPVGQCTWYVDGRYDVLHGVHVPWTTNANAYEWTQRAYDYGWIVSSTPHTGDIIDLQPYVQLAGGLGHVAIVEQVLSNGDVLASNRNWGWLPWQQAETRLVEFHPGPGVTFLHQP